jgi:hypothetical protein
MVEQSRPYLTGLLWVAVLLGGGLVTNALLIVVVWLLNAFHER